MLLNLTPHPDTPTDAVVAVVVYVSRVQPTRLLLHYGMEGDISRLVVPSWAGLRRADDLWKSTCFEVFIRSDRGGGYHEFNLSPSGLWAAYGFDGYRQGMTADAGFELRDLKRVVEAERIELIATLDLEQVGLSATEPWELGFSAVVEETSGSKSYWARVHPSDKPDFHHPDSFAFTLEPA